VDETSSGTYQMAGFGVSGVGTYMDMKQIRGCIQKFPDWTSGARTANGTASATRCS
jgi:hypothetical protein